MDIGVNFFSKQFIKEKYHKQLLDYSHEANVTHIIGISNCKKEWQLNVDLIKEYKNHPVKIYSTCGIHPHHAREYELSDKDKMIKHVQQNETVVAVGECGLDYNRNFSAQETQKEVFKHQIDVAYQLNMPLYMHERDADQDMIRILTNAKKSYPNLTGVIHCFTGDSKTMKSYLDLGFSIGITGWICDERRNLKLLEAIKTLPLDRLLIETDAPWLAPKAFLYDYDTTFSEPAALPYIIEAIANNTNYSYDSIVKETNQNTKKMFNFKRVVKKQE